MDAGPTSAALNNELAVLRLEEGEFMRCQDEAEG